MLAVLTACPADDASPGAWTDCSCVIHSALAAIMTSISPSTLAFWQSLEPPGRRRLSLLITGEQATRHRLTFLCPLRRA